MTEKSCSDIPLFSIVIPIFNRAHLIGTAIQSVLSQTCQSFEILIVDDGSKDDVAAAMAPYTDPRISIVRQPNRGASAARNQGIDLARGRFVAFLDSDDVFLPHHLATTAEALEGRDDTVAYSPVRAMRGGGYIVKPPRAVAPGEAMATYLMCARGFVQTSGLVVPIDGVKRVRYRQDVSFGDDTDFAVRLELAGYRFVMMEAPGVEWFDGPDPGRLSNSELRPDQLIWLEDLRPNIPARAYRGYRGWHVAKAAFTHRPLAALGLYLSALLGGSYSPKMAIVVLAQIVIPSSLYRRLADLAVTAIVRAPRHDER